jgi:FSR family fosmidomycin resistance protein-like MFS transporter
MTATLCGLLWLSQAHTFTMLILGAGLLGIGSAIFHPESSRVARMAAGHQPGLAQSLFQVGGNAGSSIGPLLGAFIVVPHGQSSIAWCSSIALVGILVLWRVGGWYKRHPMAAPRSKEQQAHAADADDLRRVAMPMTILAALIFSKYFYLASLNSYYTFYLITKFHVTVRTAELDLFVFLAAVAAGTILGGPLGDRFGRKWVIWGSIFGVCPFTLMLPYANLFWTPILTVLIGLILASAFSAIVVYAQELLPGRVGLVSGVFFGFAFGVAGIGAAVLGAVADRAGIEFVYKLCAFLPLIGVLAGFLPTEPVKSSVTSRQ